MTLGELVTLRKSEVAYFINLLNNYGDEIELNNMLLFSMLPFKSTDVLKEKYLFERNYRLNIPTYESMIILLADKDVLDRDKLHRFIEKNQINFDSFNTDLRIKGNLFYESTKNENIYSLFNKEYTSKDSEYKSFVFRKTAETIAKDNLDKEGKEFIYVSQDIGDNFGYDFIIRDKNGFMDYYKVKNTSFGKMDVTLNDRETELFRRMNGSVNEKYHVIIIDFKGIQNTSLYFDMVDINHDGEKINCNALFGKNFVSREYDQELKFKRITVDEIH